MAALVSALLRRRPAPRRLAAASGSLLSVFTPARRPRASVGSPRSAFSSSSSSSSSSAADAEFALGVKHLMGTADAGGQRRSGARAAVLHWTNAALGGHVRAQSALGLLYLHGHAEVPRNEALARQFLRQAADAGHDTSCHELGKLLFGGRAAADGVQEQDCAAALGYWTRAADNGHMAASYDLAHLYATGTHVERDDAKAARLLAQAAAKGMPEAHRALGQALLHGRGVERDEPRAAAHLRQAADAGLAAAQFDLGACYLLGRGVARDAQQAAQMFFLAAETGGVAEAQLCLAQLFERGEGVPADRAKAVQYYRLAADAGLQDARQALQRLGAGPEAE